MVNLWIKALKEYNATRDSWTVPKKGTADYDVVKEMMENMKGNEHKKEDKDHKEHKKENKKRGKKSNYS